MQVEGGLDGAGLRILVLVSRFNDVITQRLASAACSTALRCGVRPQDVVLGWVPGAWELPVAAATALASGKWDAVVALGCLIRGQTLHYELIAREAAKGLANLQIEHRVPVTFGVLTVDSLEDATHRSGGKFGNKGGECMLAAIEQARMLESLTKVSAGARGSAGTASSGPTAKRRAPKTAGR